MTDQELLSTLRDVNPIPDPNRLLTDEAEADAFFAAVQAVRPISPPAHPSERRRPRRWLLAAAVVALVVLVGGAAVLVGGVNPDSPVATTPTDVPGSFRWSRVSGGVFFAEEGAQWMNSVTAGGPGLVAVGSSVRSDGEIQDEDAAVWTSADGTHWFRVPHVEAVFGGEDAQRMNSVTAGGPGLVAVGSVASIRSDGEIQDEDAAVWTSVDGTAWTRVPHDEAIFGGPDTSQRMNSVTAAGPGLVAVGFATRGALFTDAGVWTSVDGIAWSRVPHDEAVFGGAADQEMSSVTAGGPGVVAVGHGKVRIGSPGDAQWLRGQDAPAWTSVDGIAWTRVAHDEKVFGGAAYHEMFSVTAGGPGLVAVGTAGFFDTDDFDAAVWVAVPED